MDKKIRCPKCGGEHLQFVNVPVSVKGKCSIIRYFRIFLWFAAILIAITLPAQFQSFAGKPASESTPGLIAICITFALECITITEAIILTVIEYFVPYRNNNVIHYVCENCGYSDDLETIALKDSECITDNDAADS